TGGDQRKLDAAIAAFSTAAQADSGIDARGPIEYCKGIQIGKYARLDGGNLQSAMNAVVLMSRRKHAEAEAIWKSLLDLYSTPDFRERAGCAISFLRSAPIVLTGAALGKSWRTPAQKNSKLRVVGGTVHLKADLSRAKSVNLVLFFVDDKLVGITNKPPFQYAWLTTEVANGPHTVKIQGTDRSGISITEKTAQVIVKNEGRAIPSARVKSEEADRLWKRLSKSLELKPSLAAINYNLAMCALETKDTQGAIAALERVMAANPGYLDAADRLAGLYGSRGAQPKVYGFNTSRKVIALTFDDGPKPNTAELLSVLSRKSVKATFFVVGKQVRAYPDVFKKIVAGGHEIANHSYYHRDMEYLTDREIGQEIFSTVALVRSLTGRGMSFLRPPGAHAGSKLPAIVKKFGITCVYWTANCSKVEGTTREKMVNHVVNSAKPGGVVLMHNLEGVTLRALPGIIDTLRAKGYEFVTLSQMPRS
ncbi:MAG: polysaccharide deacetylase family protein, partial [Armatimonadetes bacterium]|nr:polysaccharide deacetylase family protein [Armatimonadota bacterium]